MWWIRRKRSLIGAKSQNRKTPIGTKICHKNPQNNPIFVVRKWSPQEVVLFLTLEVVLLLALERLKRGTKTNSPAYVCIYIYTHTRVQLPLYFPPRSHSLFGLFPSFQGATLLPKSHDWQAPRCLSQGSFRLNWEGHERNQELLLVLPQLLEEKEREREKEAEQVCERERERRDR